MPSDEPHTPSPDGLDILAEMQSWRAAHPTATLTEIEAALDERLAALRRQLLSDTLANSPQADWSSRPPDARPSCPSCQVPLQPRGKRTRQLRTVGGAVSFERTYGICPVCGSGFFPPR